MVYLGDRKYEILVLVLGENKKEKLDEERVLNFFILNYRLDLNWETS